MSAPLERFPKNATPPTLGQIVAETAEQDRLAEEAKRKGSPTVHHDHEGHASRTPDALSAAAAAASPGSGKKTKKKKKKESAQEQKRLKEALERLRAEEEMSRARRRAEEEAELARLLLAEEKDASGVAGGANPDANATDEASEDDESSHVSEGAEDDPVPTSPFDEEGDSVLPPGFSFPAAEDLLRRSAPADLMGGARLPTPPRSQKERRTSPMASLSSTLTQEAATRGYGLVTPPAVIRQQGSLRTSPGGLPPSFPKRAMADGNKTKDEKAVIRSSADETPEFQTIWAYVWNGLSSIWNAIANFFADLCETDDED
jgi:hypothetical protein